MMHLTVLGTFELRAAEDAVTVLPTDKARALCTYLALEAPRPHRRETLAALLWPDILHESALTNLRQTLYRLRLALEQGQPGAADALLTVDRQTVQPHLQHWAVDALTFTGLLDACERATTLAAETEAIVHFQRGLQLIDAWPDSPKRQRCELALQIALGIAMVRVRGYSAAETGAAFMRAHALCRLLGDIDHLFTILMGLENYYSAPGEFDRALALAEELIALAEQRHDPRIGVAGHSALSEVLFYQGVFPGALAHLEQAIAAYDPRDHALYLRWGSDDPGISSMILAAGTLWNLGYPEQARRRIATALALAEELGDPYTLMGAQFWNAAIHLWVRDYAVVRSEAAAVMQLCSKHNFHYFLGLATCLEGWALAMQGAEVAGIAQIRQGLALWGDIGANRSRHAYLGLLAEAYGRAGDYGHALQVVDHALAAVLPGGGFSEADLYRLRGEFLMEQAASATASATAAGATAGAVAGAAAEDIFAQSEKALRRAVAIAQAQGAKSLELRACMVLGRLWQRQGKPAAAEQLLGGIYSWFTEGFDTPDLQEAQQLLAALRQQSPPAG